MTACTVRKQHKVSKDQQLTCGCWLNIQQQVLFLLNFSKPHDSHLPCMFFHLGYFSLDVGWCRLFAWSQRNGVALADRQKPHTVSEDYCSVSHPFGELYKGHCKMLTSIAWLNFDLWYEWLTNAQPLSPNLKWRNHWLVWLPTKHWQRVTGKWKQWMNYEKKLKLESLMIFKFIHH